MVNKDRQVNAARGATRERPVCLGNRGHAANRAQKANRANRVNRGQRVRQAMLLPAMGALPDRLVRMV